MGGVVLPIKRAALDRDWMVVRTVLPDGWREAARSCRAIRWNKGPLAEPETLLRVLLGLAASSGSLRGTAMRAKNTRLVSVSHVAILKRLKRSVLWLEWIVRAMLLEFLEPDCESSLRLRLYDGTSLSKPASTGTDFRLHLKVSASGPRIVGAELTDASGGESLTRFAVQPGDVTVADRCYGTAGEIAHVARGAGYAVARINASSLPLFGEGGMRLDPLRLARKAPGAYLEVPTEVRPKQGPAIRGRLCLYALTKGDAAKSQRRVRRAKYGKQKRTGKRAIESAKYVFVFTLLPRTMATTRQVFFIYRLRWQVELAIKTLKSVCGLDEVPHRDAVPGRACVLAKLICALIAQRLASHGRAPPPLGRRRGPPRRSVPHQRSRR